MFPRPAAAVFAVAVGIWSALSLKAEATSPATNAAAEIQAQFLKPVPAGVAGFTRLDLRQTGLNFTNRLEGDAFLTNAVANNGSGLAIGDVDGDGRPDIYLCALQGPSRLFRNRGISVSRKRRSGRPLARINCPRERCWWMWMGTEIWTYWSMASLRVLGFF